MLQKCIQQSRISVKAMGQVQCGNTWQMSTWNCGCWFATKRASRSLQPLCSARLKPIILPVVSPLLEIPIVGQCNKSTHKRHLLMLWLNGLWQMTRYVSITLHVVCAHINLSVSQCCWVNGTLKYLFDALTKSDILHHLTIHRHIDELLQQHLKQLEDDIKVSLSRNLKSY